MWGVLALGSVGRPGAGLRGSTEVEAALGRAREAQRGGNTGLRQNLGSLSPCAPNRDVLCGFLLCVNISGAPRLGDLGGDISSVTFYHQGKELDCRCCLGLGWEDEV